MPYSENPRFRDRRHVLVAVLYASIVVLGFSLIVTIAVKKYSTPGGYVYDERTTNEWVGLHNERRYRYHTKYGGEFVPLKWSNSLAAEAHAWASTLSRSNCNEYHHDPHNDVGENLAVIWGADSIERVMHAWVEEEELDPNERYRSGHGHMTQVLWRATRYVGCSRVTNDECHIYVCRYIKPGNCNRGDRTWLRDMMADESPCGPDCPDEGCHQEGR